MSERLSDQALKMAQDAAHQMMDGHIVDVGERAVQGAIIDMVLKELRERCAQDMSSEDVEALRWMRAQAKRADDGAPTINTQRALVLLDKLLATRSGTRNDFR